MTLCAIWTDGESVQMATDSRLGDVDRHVDTSVKVMAIPIRILEPSSKGLHDQKSVTEWTYGLCAAGHYIPTMAMKDSLRALLSSVWIVPRYGILSMDRLASIAASMLERIWYKCIPGLGANVSATVGLIGYCPAERRQRVFILSTEVDGGRAVVLVNEHEPSPEGLYFGSGLHAAEALRRLRPDLTPAEVVRSVANDDGVPTVGGRVQYGKVRGENFEVFAVVDYDVDHENRTATVGHYFAGVEIMGGGSPDVPDGYHLLPRTANLFHREWASLMKAGYAAQGRGGEVIQLIGRPHSQARAAGDRSRGVDED